MVRLSLPVLRLRRLETQGFSKCNPGITGTMINNHEYFLKLQILVRISEREQWESAFWTSSLDVPDAPQTLRTTELEYLNVVSFCLCPSFGVFVLFFFSAHWSFFFSFLSKYLCTSVSPHVLCQQLRPGDTVKKWNFVVLYHRKSDHVSNHPVCRLGKYFKPQTLSFNENICRSANWKQIKVVLF